MKIRKHWLIACMALAVVCGGCTSQKKMTYFHQLDAQAIQEISRQFKTQPEAKIVAGDVLLINVSALDPETVVAFNQKAVANTQPGEDRLTATPVMLHYTVEKDGTIQFPVLGKVKVAGLTRLEAEQMLTQEIEKSVQDPMVTVSFINRHVTVIGEVAKPGTYPMNTERLTILEALSYAGDLTPYAKRNTILVAREKDGQLTFGRVNLNESGIFTSPYYYMQPNDVVYVEPNNVRVMNSQNISLYLSMGTTLASMATVIISVVTLSK